MVDCKSSLAWNLFFIVPCVSLQNFTYDLNSPTATGSYLIGLCSLVFQCCGKMPEKSQELKRKRFWRTKVLEVLVCGYLILVFWVWSETEHHLWLEYHLMTSRKKGKGEKEWEKSKKWRSGRDLNILFKVHCMVTSFPSIIYLSTYLSTFLPSCLSVCLFMYLLCVCVPVCVCVCGPVIHSFV